jgi:hypothetical protein
LLLAVTAQMAWHSLPHPMLWCATAASCLPLHQQGPAGYFDWQDVEQFTMSADGSSVAVNPHWLQELQSRQLDHTICKQQPGEDPPK